MTNLILDRFKTSDVDGFIYQSAETFHVEKMENDLSVSNNMDPSVADTNLVLFSDKFLSVNDVKDLSKA